MEDVQSDRRAALDVALEMADADAGWGDFGLALRWLDAAESLDGRLAPDYAAKRRLWQDLLAERAAALPGDVPR